MAWYLGTAEKDAGIPDSKAAVDDTRFVLSLCHSLKRVMTVVGLSLGSGDTLCKKHEWVSLSNPFAIHQYYNSSKDWSIDEFV